MNKKFKHESPQPALSSEVGIRLLGPEEDRYFKFFIRNATNFLAKAGVAFSCPNAQA